MSRKDYERVAEAMRAARADVGGSRLAFVTTEIALAAVFAADNPRFDCGRFLAACRKDDPCAT